MRYEQVVVLGAGVTGISAATTLQAPIYEKRKYLGGKCASYFIQKTGGSRVRGSRPRDSYLFEQGGGHWVWVNDESVLQRLQQESRLRGYRRRAAVYFPENQSVVPYPVQYNLSYFDEDTRTRILTEIDDSQVQDDPPTLKRLLKIRFGETLCERFFFPFHEQYTQGLYKYVKPDETYKTPNNKEKMIQGAFSPNQGNVGYNQVFYYPERGLFNLVSKLASNLSIYYNKEVTQIDAERNRVIFNDGVKLNYKYLVSTLPLSKMMALSGLDVGEREGPHTSTLVLNVSGEKGDQYPEHHWLYIPRSKSGFYRVGFYSNVDEMFLPSNRTTLGSSYVEKSFTEKPSGKQAKRYIESVVDELVSWGFYKNIDMIDPTWVDTAYTWSWLGSTWVDNSIKLLREYGIFSTGRYGLWRNQGVADSILNGLGIGETIEQCLIPSKKRHTMQVTSNQV